MNNSIYPCIWCDNNAKNVAEFYLSVFPDIKITADNQVVILVEIYGQKFMLLNGGDIYKPNPTISFMVHVDSEDEVVELWNKLSAGGEPLMPLDSYPWSKKYGWISDKYGVSWQLYFGEKTNSKQIISPTLMYGGNQNGKCEKAIELYTSLFPNSSVQGILRYPEGGENTAGLVQHAQFDIDNYTLMTMDGGEMHEFGFTEGVSLVVECKNQAEIDKYWDGLTANGGEESMCGWLKDPFGVSWQIVPNNLGEILDFSNPEKAKKASEVLFKMKKIEISKFQ